MLTAVCFALYPKSKNSQGLPASLHPKMDNPRPPAISPTLKHLPLTVHGTNASQNVSGLPRWRLWSWSPEKVRSNELKFHWEQFRTLKQDLVIAKRQQEDSVRKTRTFGRNQRISRPFWRTPKEQRDFKTKRRVCKDKYRGLQQ